MRGAGSKRLGYTLGRFPCLPAPGVGRFRHFFRTNTSMTKVLRFFNYFDWVVAVGTLVVGLVLMNGWVIASGLLGLALAWYKPAERIKKRMEKSFLRKPAKVEDSAHTQGEDAFYANVLGTAQPAALEDAPSAAATAPATPVGFAFGPRGYGAVRLSVSKHNQLRPEHLELGTMGTEPRAF